LGLTKKEAPHNWTNLHKWSKIEGFFEMKITLSAYVERNKKIIEIPDFCAQLPACLVEISQKFYLY